MAELQQEQVLGTGIHGLDEILEGGFAEGRLFIVKGGPGTGKSTLCLQFLLEGIRNGERCLYIGVGGAGDSICTVANSHGWFLDREYFFIHEVEASREPVLAPRRRTFHSSDVDLGEKMGGIVDALEKVQPKRVVVDTLAEFRLLCEDDIEYRRQFMTLRLLLAEGNRTALITDYGDDFVGNLNIEAIAHGSILLEVIQKTFGPDRRRLRVEKYRARRYRSGWHDFTIDTGGINVFPTYLAADYPGESPRAIFTTGNHLLDQLLGGGVERGTSTAIIGPSGIGKSALSTHFMVAAAEKGEKASAFLFDESRESFLARSDSIGLPVREQVRAGNILLRQVDVAELSPGEFTAMVRDEVVRAGVSTFVIDSLNGYLQAMQDENALLVQLHELFSFLGRRGVMTLLVVTQHGLLGSAMQTPVDVSYIADNILLLRFFEFKGEVRRALSVVKKRRGKHELTVREMKITDSGIGILEPMSCLQGVLTGEPTLVRDS